MADQFRGFFHQLIEKTLTLDERIENVKTAKKAYEVAAEKCMEMISAQQNKLNEAKSMENQAAVNAITKNIKLCQDDFKSHQKSAANFGERLCQLELKQLSKQAEKKSAMPIGFLKNMNKPKKPKSKLRFPTFLKKSTSMANLSASATEPKAETNSGFGTPVGQYGSLENLSSIAEHGDEAKQGSVGVGQSFKPSAPPKKTMYPDFD